MKEFNIEGIGVCEHPLTETVVFELSARLFKGRAVKEKTQRADVTLVLEHRHVRRRKLVIPIRIDRIRRELRTRPGRKRRSHQTLFPRIASLPT